MHINASLFSLALAGFISLAAAQPHGADKHVRRNAVHNRHAKGLKARQAIEVVTVYVDQYGNVLSDHQPAATEYPSPNEGGKKVPSKFSKTSMESVTSTVPASLVSPAPSSGASSTTSADSYQNTSIPKIPDTGSGNSNDSNNNNNGTSSTGQGVDTTFPDGKIDCDDFPSDYGAIGLDWVTLQGWSGIQINDGNGDKIGKCTEGAYCSYACPPGYSKAQWPEIQPMSGESRGGLLCKNGKLRLTRPSYPKLCQPGVGTASVRNKLSKLVPICRTDYPGSENMVIPLSCSPGSTSPLTVPDSGDSYEWQGKSTSAQYYVNPAGTPLKDGCTWGVPGAGLGNWSPMVFGAGYSGGKTWLSISQNQLNSKPLNFNVRIVGDNVSSDCKYEDGVFSGGGSGESGCTTCVTSGNAYFELY